MPKVWIVSFYLPPGCAAVSSIVLYGIAITNQKSNSENRRKSLPDRHPMCNPTDIATKTVNETGDPNNSKNKEKMPMIDGDQSTGPFAEFTSGNVLSRLGEFQQSVDSTCGEAIATNAHQPQHAAGIQWKDVSIENVLGEGGFSFIFKVRAAPFAESMHGGT